VTWFYLGKLAWPADLMFIYPRWSVDAAVWWQYLFSLGVLALVAGLFLLARRPRNPLARAAAAGLAGFLIFAVTLFPAMGFFNVYPFRFSYVADHFQYLASLGLIVPLAALTLAARPLVNRRTNGPRLLVPVGAAVLVATLGVLTWHQSSVYRDAETLYLATLARNPGCWLAHNNLGSAWSQLPGRLNDAIAEYQTALRLQPDYAEAHYNLGFAWSQLPGRLDDAIAEYQAALRLQPDYAEAHNNLGNVWSQLPGRLNDAIAEYEAALRLKPDDARAHNNLGSALAQLPGRLNDAIAEYQAALRLQPDYAEAHYDLGNALAQLPGRLSGAITEYEAALRLKPDFAPGWHNLGVSWIHLGNLPAATAAFREEVRLAPDDLVARRALDAVQRQTEGY
jgi:tetratricopeptide (TPR) repeat protein